MNLLPPSIHGVLPLFPIRFAECNNIHTVYKRSKLVYFTENLYCIFKNYQTNIAVVMNFNILDSSTKEPVLVDQAIKKICYTLNSVQVRMTGKLLIICISNYIIFIWTRLLYKIFFKEYFWFAFVASNVPVSSKVQFQKRQLEPIVFTVYLL